HAKALHKHSLQLPQQIVEMYKNNFKIENELQDEALTKLLAYGRVFLVALEDEIKIIDEYSNKVTYKQDKKELFYLEFTLNQKKKIHKKVVDYIEKHIYFKQGDKVIHQTYFNHHMEQEVVKKMPQEYALTISGKRGVPCYFYGIKI